MYPRVRTGCVRFSRAILFVTLIGSAPLDALEITMDVGVGFRGLFHLGMPFPLSVHLRNSGPPVGGSLEVKVWKGGASKGILSHPFLYRKEVFVSPQSEKEARFTVDPDSVAMPLAVSFSAPGGTVRKEVDLRDHFSLSPLILLLTGSRMLPSPLAAWSDPVISVSPEELPPDVRAYRGVRAIVFYEQSLRDLSRSQVAALDLWLGSGGTMVILGGLDYALYQEPSMLSFLPVRVTGLKRLRAVPGLEKLHGKPVAASDIVVQDSSLVKGRVVIQEKGTPLWVEAVRGKGRVRYLSLDLGRLPMSRWGGASSLFADLLSPIEGRSSPQSTWDERVFSVLFATHSFAAASNALFPFLVSFALYGGGLVILARLWRAKRLSDKVAALSFFSLVGLAASGGTFYFYRGGNLPDGVLLSSTILDGYPDGFVEAQSNVALFSTRHRRYDLYIENGWTELELASLDSWAGGDAVAVTESEGRGARFQFSLREWDHGLFKVRMMGQFPLRMETGHDGGRPSLLLFNASSRDLTECWVFSCGQRIFVGEIPAGSNQKRNLPVCDAKGGGNWKALREIPFRDESREVLFQKSVFPEDWDAVRYPDGLSLFLGWVKNAPRKVWAMDPRVLALGDTLIRVSLPAGDKG